MALAKLPENALLRLTTLVVNMVTTVVTILAAGGILHGRPFAVAASF